MDSVVNSMKRILLLLFMLVKIGKPLIAQPGALDLSFNPGSGADTQIYTTSIQQDGKIIIGGRFNSYNGDTVNKIARLHPDGSLDTAFMNLGLNSTVWAIAIQPDGKIIIAGRFTRYNNNVYINRIMRLNTDGSPDTTFNPGTGFNDYVYALALQSDGKILAGGNFTAYNGISSPRLARLNADGSIDTTFNIGTGFDKTVEDIAIQPFDNKIVICGDFTNYKGVFAGRVIRLNTDGTKDPAFIFNWGASSVAYAIAIQDDRKIAVAGSFHNYNNIQTGRMARLHPDGDRDSNFDPGFGASADIRDIEIITAPDGKPKYLIIGDFTSFDQTPFARVALVDTMGNLDLSFDPGTGADSILQSISRQQDGRIILAGEMATYDGVPRKGIARIYACETPQPGMIAGDDSIECSGEVLVYSVPVSVDADRYEWTLPAGWTGTSDSNSISVISNGQGGVISVRAFSDSCGYSQPQTKTIYRILPPEVAICLVTVDTASTHNILLWEKPADKSFIDSFFMYRETTTNVYTKIGAVHRDSLSAYHDYNADPNITSYRYKMSVIDTCGTESALSDFHNTIHLQNLGNGNFQWTFYDIENETNPATEFNIYRDNLGNGNFTQIGLVPGTNSTFTDVNYSSFPNSIYVVDVNWSRSCTPQRGPVNTTRSNIRRVNRIDTLPEPPDTTSVSIQPVLQESFLVYPNPAEDILTIEFTLSAQIQHIQLFNTLCQLLYDEQQIKLNAAIKKTISVAALPKGIYMLVVETDSSRVKRKVVIQ